MKWLLLVQTRDTKSLHEKLLIKGLYFIRTEPKHALYSVFCNHLARLLYCQNFSQSPKLGNVLTFLNTRIVGFRGGSISSNSYCTWQPYPLATKLVPTGIGSFNELTQLPTSYTNTTQLTHPKADLNVPIWMWPMHTWESLPEASNLKDH